MKLEPQDCRVSEVYGLYRGFQKARIGCKILHIPTGISVTECSGMTQWVSRSRAWDRLEKIVKTATPINFGQRFREIRGRETLRLIGQLGNNNLDINNDSCQKIFNTLERVIKLTVNLTKGKGHVQKW